MFSPCLNYACSGKTGSPSYNHRAALQPVDEWSCVPRGKAQRKQTPPWSRQGSRLRNRGLFAQLVLEELVREIAAREA
jgi:hypothetical protein